AETTRECVDSLLDLGLDAITWLPWYPELPPPPPEYRVAVVAGEPDLVPAGVEQILDIGVRIFDFGTIAEILGRLGITTVELGQYSRRYLAKIVSLARRLARSNEEARRLSGHLGSVLDSLRHGILVYDNSGRVSVCNEELRELLAHRGASPVGASVSSVIYNKDLLEFLEYRSGEDEAVFKLPSGPVVVRRFDLGSGGHTVAVFRGEGDEAAEASRLGREYRRRGHVAKWTMDDIIGDSEPLRRAKHIAGRLAATDLSILINGESGTGKELFASAIHTASARAAGPFLAVDLGALSDDLIESELFGYDEGAFTGARKGGKAGLFELADGGTLFLDEIGNVSAKVQTRLLRALQEKEIMRVGGSDIKHVDVRIIAATKEDLLEKARKGSFREDLYFRLKMGWIRLPALRERPQDIPALVHRILSIEGCRDLRVSPDVLAELSSREWPGNIRELRNTLTYMIAIRESACLESGDLPEPGYFSGEQRVYHHGLDNRSASHRAVANTDGQELGESELASISQLERFVLAAIASLAAEGRHAGRALVSEMARRQGLDLGQGTVRSIMTTLAARGYVQSNRGRGGTRLSPAGMRMAASIGFSGLSGSI
ncbi:MAG: sigma 54-interacting transcriptional regulator, partial [Spirochaetales bacterium]|nr:sigma 54-interacting transcriptional regulator [Spirochaetales bacterium]